MFSKPTGINIEFTKNSIPTDEGVILSEDHILQRCPFYIFLGPPRSGKSTVIQTLICNEHLYLKKFTQIFLISPSGFPDLELELEKNWYPTLNLEWLSKKFTELTILDKQQQVLVILDDCVSELKSLENKPEFTKLFYNRRHIKPKVCVSIFLTSQYWSKIPASIRGMCTGIFIFSINSTEVSKMIKELPFGDNTTKIKTIISTLGNSKPHEFIYINFINNKKYLNFESELLFYEFF